jgi:hypothetical protein
MATNVFTAIDTALETVLEAAGLTVYPYESPTLTRVPVTTFTPDGFSSDYTRTDQGEGFGVVEYKIRHYVDATKKLGLSWADMKTDVNTIRAALGADPTLGGAVRDCAIMGGRIRPVRTVNGGKAELMAEIDIAIRPKPFIGTA